MNNVREFRSYIRGDIFYADLGKGIGSEQCGERPVMVIQNDTGNRYSPTLIVVTITSKQKKLMPTHFLIEANEKNGLTEDSIILFEQIRTIDKKRLIGNKIGSFMNDELDEKIKISLGIKDKNDNIYEHINKVAREKAIEIEKLDAIINACLDMSGNTINNYIKDKINERKMYESAFKKYCNDYKIEMESYYTADYNRGVI